MPEGFVGIYHVLGGVLSALDGIGPDRLTLGRLEERMQDHPPREIILALPATVDGQSHSACGHGYAGSL